MSPILISIIMPAYNAAAYITQAIESILAQTHENWELLIVEDASQDDTLDKIEKYIYDKRIKIFRQNKTLGLLKSINLLLNEALGSYICFQMPEDYAHPQRLALQLSTFMDQVQLGVLGTAYYKINTENTHQHTQIMPLSYKEIQAQMPKSCAMLFNTIMLKREIVQRLGGLRLFFKAYAKAEYDWIYLLSEKYECMNLQTPLYYARIDEKKNKDMRPNIFIGNKIVQYLAVQRREKGKDDLQNNQYHALNMHIQKLLNPFQKDPSLIYRKYAEDYLQHRLHANALWAAWQSICTAPNKIVNYRTYISCLRTTTLQKIIKS